MVPVWLIWFLVSATLLAGSNTEENLQFEIHKGGKPVGELQANKQTIGDRVIYTSFSKTEIRFLFRIRVWYEYRVEYRAGKLIEADAKILVNEDLHKQTNVRFDGKRYVWTERKKRGEEVKHIEAPVHYSSILFLFEEPDGFKASFSEEEGVFHKLEKVGDHTYERTNSKGRVNRYVYDGSSLRKVYMDAGLFNFEIVRKEDQ